EGVALTVAVHEDAVNDLLSQFPLAGISVSDREIDRFVALLRTMLNAGPATGEDEEDSPRTDGQGFATILLDENQPIGVQFGGGTIRITVHVGFRPSVGPEIPVQRITIPFTLSMEDRSVQLIPGEVSIEGLPGE